MNIFIRCAGSDVSIAQEKDVLSCCMQILYRFSLSVLSRANHDGRSDWTGSDSNFKIAANQGSCKKGQLWPIKTPDAQTLWHLTKNKKGLELEMMFSRLPGNSGVCLARVPVAGGV